MPFRKVLTLSALIIPLVVVHPVLTLFQGSSLSLANQPAVPILVYHRFGPFRSDSMTVTTAHFEGQLELLSRHGYCVVPLRDVVAWLMGKKAAPPPRSIVLTFDDGNLSQYREALPLIQKSRFPVTLFIYPSCISHASYAMTWEQLSNIYAQGYLSIASHTFWHPNFKQEETKRTQAEYDAFVDMQLRKSKAILEEHFCHPVDLIAWPFGIYDPYLVERAQPAGYQAGFSIECRAATTSDDIMALPRCLVSDEDVGPRFLRLLDTAMRRARK